MEERTYGDKAPAVAQIKTLSAEIQRLLSELPEPSAAKEKARVAYIRGKVLMCLPETAAQAEEHLSRAVRVSPHRRFQKGGGRRLN